MTGHRLLLGVCGLYCGACCHHRASFADRRHLLEVAARHGRELEGFACGGCRSGRFNIHPGCAQCEIRACAEDRGTPHCGLCPEFHCERLRAFQTDGRAHHLDVLDNLEHLAAIGPDRWLAGQEQRWTCACGSRFSWYEDLCYNYGRDLASYGADPRTIADNRPCEH